MSFDRETALKKAEKLLRQGRLDPAIAEYLRVVEAEPGDWATANTLGDLYVRAGQSPKAAGQYRRVAEHFLADGFYPRAAAIYKKLLKLNPDDELSQLKLADVSQKQGLLADAKAYLNAVAARRRARGDRAGAAEIVLLLGDVDPGDFDARAAAARMLAEMRDEEAAARRFRAIADDLLEKDRPAEALEALREAVRLNPYDREGRVTLARAAVGAGDLAAARSYLDRETAGDDPSLLMALLEVELQDGRLDDARALVPELLTQGAEQRERVVDMAWPMAAGDPAAAFVLISSVADSDAAAGHLAAAASVLQQFVARVPDDIPALRKLVDVCVDGGLESLMHEAQGQLADAYLAAGLAAEARATAEDLVAREPWVHSHLERFRRALVMLKVPEPDMVIAERLGGHTPFLATDVFGAPDAPLTVGATDHPAAVVQAIGNPGDAPPQEPEQAAGAPVKPQLVAAAHERPSDEIDLTGALGTLDADEAEEGGAGADAPAPAGQSLEDAFANVRQQVTQQTGADQAAHHMTLARTYLQMGLEDQAVMSLKAASRSPQFRFEAASRLGRFYRDQGDIAEAAAWLERATEATAPTPDEGRAVLYEWGIVLEEKGDTARALAVFLELQADDGEYQDVARRVERLTRAEPEPEAGG